MLCCVLIDSDQSLRDYLLDLYNTEILERGIIGPANNKLKAQGRTNLANGISLDVTDDLQG